MTVSDEQAAAINSGTKHVRSFRKLDLGAGPRPIPAWALDAHVDFNDNFSNAPEVQLKIAYDPLRQEPLPAIWHRREDGKTWIGISEGMASVHYHSGPLSRADDGVMETSQQDGYCGRAFKVRMAPDSLIEPGEIVRLRGPWHGGAPQGFVEVHCLVADEAYKERAALSLRWRKRSLKHSPSLGKDYLKWWRQTLSFGWYVSEPVFLNIMATFLPHLEWAWVHESYGWRLQPCRPETGMPKGFYQDATHCQHKFNSHDWSKYGKSCLLCGTVFGQEPEQ